MSRLNKWTTIASCWFLALVFVYAGFDKVFHYEGFVRALSSYTVIPSGGARYIAASVVLAEITLGLGLLLPRWRETAALLSAGMLVLFTAALAINHFTNPEAICGCWFTITLAQGTGAHVIQNLMLAGLAGVVFLTERAPTVPARATVA